ncbi:MAG: hypothetical protein OEW39_00100 [Deltaproteobacteria bacterium]|nr:hypothetical protein [Deltaproteobacteria bacterium]
MATAPVTTDIFNNLPDEIRKYVESCSLKIDKIRYSIPREYKETLIKEFGSGMGTKRKGGRQIVPLQMVRGNKVRLSFSKRISLNPYEWPILEIDDPTEYQQKLMVEHLRRYTNSSFRLSAVEVALDLTPLPEIWMHHLFTKVLQHIHLPYSRREPRKYIRIIPLECATVYIGGVRKSPRFIRIYVKEPEGGANPFLRVEWNVRRNFSNYGLLHKGLIDLSGIKMEKLLAWRDFDLDKAVDLMLLRTKGAYLDRKDPYSALYACHLESWLKTKTGRAGFETPVFETFFFHVKNSGWYINSDKSVVFPQM